MKLNVLERSCGDCMMCCKLLGISELRKHKDQWCPHARAKCGCQIYEDRPVECRNYECAWLQGAMTDADRPDKVGVVMDLVENLEGVMEVHITSDPQRPRALEQAENVSVYMMKLLHAGFAVVHKNGMRRDIFEVHERSEGDKVVKVTSFDCRVHEKAIREAGHPKIADRLIEVAGGILTQVECRDAEEEVIKAGLLELIESLITISFIPTKGIG